MAKINRKSVIALIASAAILIAVAGGSACKGKSGAKTAEDFGITQETAQSGQISKVVNGTGALTAADSSAVKVPVGAKVLEVYVEDGEHIDKGDRIAKLDAISLKEIVVSLDESIDAQEEKIDNLDTSDKHYQEKLEIARAALAEMRENRDKAAVLAKDPVLVSDRSGLISSVNLKEGEKTTQSIQNGGGSNSIDSNLLSTLLLGCGESAVSFRSGEYYLLSSEAVSDEEDSVNTADNGEADAAPAPEQEPAPAAEEPAPAEESEAASAGEDSEIMPAEEPVSEPEAGSEAENTEPESIASEEVKATEETSAKAASEDENAETSGQAEVKLIQLPFKNITLSLAAPAAGAVPQNGIALPDGSHIKASIVWVPSHERFVAGSVYIAVIALQADNGYCFPDETNVPEVKIDSCKNARISKHDLNLDGHPDTILAVCPYVIAPDSGDVNAILEQLNALAEQEMTTVREQLEAQIALLLKNVTDSASGSISEIMKGIGSGMDFSGLDLSSLMGSAYSDLDLSSLSGLSGADLSGLAVGSSSSGSSYYETDAVTVIPDEKVFLDINIDEMDINTLYIGQAARITVDAIPGEHFDGEIIKIANTKNGETSLTGGSSSAKYSVRISLPWQEQMKFGMTAAASITADTREGVVLVPMDAVMVLDGQDVVYTAFDSEGNLTEPVPVVIGLSDGTLAEVKSGLEAGDTICYVSTQYQSLFQQFETVEME